MRPIVLMGAQVWSDGTKPPELRPLPIVRGRIAAHAPRHATPIDLTGWQIFPAFLNAHDHLELNHYPRTSYRERYGNAHQWGEDVNAHLNEAPFAALRAYPLADRLFIGGLKNLLCGALTVVQHGPPHRALFAADYPVRVLRHYRWAHSLHFSTPTQIQAAHRATPRRARFYVHLAEGTDAVATAEYARLVALGCVDERTVLVHGVGLSASEIADARARGAWLITCPSTNRYLLGQTANLAAWGDEWWLGSDSRLTADGDWLDETAWLSDEQRRRLLDVPPALWPSYRGLAVGALADVVVARTFPRQRREIGLILRGGYPLIGTPDLMRQFPKLATVPATLDGEARLVAAPLAHQIERATLKETGLLF